MKRKDSKMVYLDNSSTTVICNESLKKIVQMMKSTYGNPSSLHKMGLDSENEIDIAKKIISQKINCQSEEIYFTSGGTESNNLAILGCVQSHKNFGNKIVATSIEHPSVIEPIKFLGSQGFNVVFIQPDNKGVISSEKLIESIDKNTILVSMMMVNNETGTILPVEVLKKIAKQKQSPALIHVDAVQAFCKIPINVKKLKIDLMSISAHKVHGPNGVGALYISKDVKIKPMLFGGSQQNKIRPGTESASLIVGFSEAVKLNPCYNNVLKLRNYCYERLKNIKGVEFNSGEKSSPYILNFSLLGIKSENVLHYLESENIFVSIGSACAKGKSSYVLKSMGFSKERIGSAIRVSFSRYNTIDDIDIFIKFISEAQKVLTRKY